MSSTIVTLRPDLSDTLQVSAQQQDTTVDNLVNEAVERYVREEQRHKIDREIVAFEQLHPQLWRTMPGQWVAVNNGKVVDQDQDRATLYQRIRATFGRTAVLIRQVKTVVADEIWIRTPNTGRVKTFNV